MTTFINDKKQHAKAISIIKNLEDDDNDVYDLIGDQCRKLLQFIKLQKEEKT